MAPPCNVFPVSKLELHVQADVKGKKRKLPGGADVDLTKFPRQPGAMLAHTPALSAVSSWFPAFLRLDDISL
ncbi:hypothetical protein CH35J_010811 [Colletotrichum higginsianum]|uniref:Uncharacterized protein n=1 Tax=Colletotrichum higginsianum TaxID=80884 RepID=A0A4T0VIQ4_9PEZI|nr:hypothetical protein CH35J_010811 [Colletotrichum higginsianum]